MPANSTARVTVKLLDELSRPAQIVRNALKGIRGDMQSLSGAKLGIAKQMADASARARELRSSLLNIGVAGTAGAYGLNRLMKPGTEFETILTDIRQKADLSAEATKKLGERVKELAPTVNKSAGDLIKGVDFLLGAGMTPDNAMAIIPAIGKTATAYRAEIEDLSKAGFAAMDNLKVPANEFARALDVMAVAGKSGNFELKDMATYFPQLTASAEALGMKGVDGVSKLAAVLQIARKGAGDASSAATNTANLMQKIVSPETTKKFAKAGIDIRKELKKTQKAGGDPFVMIAELVKKATKGDLAKLGDFFEDAQVQQFLRPLIASLEEYKRIRNESLAANGTVDADFKIRMETFQATIDKVTQAFGKLAIAVGEALIPALTRLAEIITPTVTSLADWVAANGQLTSNILTAVAATAGLYTAVKLAGLALVGLRVAALLGSRGLLNYLAPKGAPAPAAAPPKPGAAATTPKAGGSVPTTAAPGSATTAAPRPMTAAEIAKAGKGAAALNASGAAAVAAKGLKGGILGGIVQFVGESAIDKLFDVLPKPTMPDGYDPKAELNMSVLDRLKRLIGADKGPRQDTTAQPLDAGAFERARRAQDEYKRDPEAARGRAMMSGFGDKAASEGNTAGADLGEGIASGLDGTRASIMAKVDSIIAEARSKLTAAGLSLPITPRLEGGGAALRGIHSDTGIN